MEYGGSLFGVGGIFGLCGKMRNNSSCAPENIAPMRLGICRNVSLAKRPNRNHCTDTKNDVSINGSGSISVLLMRITCSSMQHGAAKKTTVTEQHKYPVKELRRLIILIRCDHCQL